MATTESQFTVLKNINLLPNTSVHSLYYASVFTLYLHPFVGQRIVIAQIFIETNNIIRIMQAR